MQINQPAPDFDLLDLQGVFHKLSDYRGKIVIINFWSAECPHSERTDHDLLNMLEPCDGNVVWLRWWQRRPKRGASRMSYSM
jgi:peroxiredoxin